MTKPIKILNTSLVTAMQDQVSSNLEDEVVILNLQDGVYYGLNPLGAQIWNLLQESRTVGEIRDIILEEYEVEPDRCEHGLLQLLKELAAKGLIKIEDGKTA